MGPTRGEFESTAFTKLKQILPAGWILFRNIRVPRPGQQSTKEIDAIIVGPAGVSVIEMKGYPQQITREIHGQDTEKAQQASYTVKKCLETNGPISPTPFVTPILLVKDGVLPSGLSDPNTICLSNVNSANLFKTPGHADLLKQDQIEAMANFFQSLAIPWGKRGKYIYSYEIMDGPRDVQNPIGETCLYGVRGDGGNKPYWAIEYGFGKFSHGSYVNLWKTGANVAESLASLSPESSLSLRETLWLDDNNEKTSKTFEATAYYEVYEAVDYFTMAEFCNSPYFRDLDFEKKIAFVYETVEALTSIHRSGYVHGYVSPLSIAVEVTDDGLIPKFHSFYYAFKHGDVRDVIRADQFLAPENRFPNKYKNTTTRSDIFSLGMVLFDFIFREEPLNVTKAAKKGIIPQNCYLNRMKQSLEENLPERKLLSIIEGMLSVHPKHRMSLDDALNKLDVIKEYMRI